MMHGLSILIIMTQNHDLNSVYVQKTTDYQQKTTIIIYVKFKQFLMILPMVLDMRGKQNCYTIYMCVIVTT